MDLYLKNRYLALEYARKPTKKEHDRADAFFLLIRDIPFEDLSNLCNEINNFFEKEKEKGFSVLPIEDCYKMTQVPNITGIKAIDWSYRVLVLSIAIYTVRKGKNLGNKTIRDGKINTSEWISHCIWEAEVAANLADMMGLNVDSICVWSASRLWTKICP